MTTEARRDRDAWPLGVIFIRHVSLLHVQRFAPLSKVCRQNALHELVDVNAAAPIRVVFAKQSHSFLL